MSPDYTWMVCYHGVDHAGPIEQLKWCARPPIRIVHLSGNSYYINVHFLRWVSLNPVNK